MKKGLVSKLGGAALVLTLVTASLVGGTFARYAKTVNGKATVEIATFAFDAKNAGSVLSDTMKLTNDKLMPGSTGEFKIALTGGDDIDVEYTVTIAKAAGIIPDNLKFAVDGTEKDLTTSFTTTATKLDSNNADDEVVISWSWPEGTAGADTYNPATITPIEFAITAVGNQVATTPAP